MPYFCLDDVAKPSGKYEVHLTLPQPCTHLPEPANRVDLGEHASCFGAIAKAMNTRPSATVQCCAYCCPRCHPL